MSNVVTFPKKKEIPSECPKCGKEMQPGQTIEEGKVIRGLLCASCLVWVKKN